MQRDLFSSFLCRYVNDNDELQVFQVQSDWERAEPLLTQAWGEYKTASTKSSTESGSVISSSERVCVEGKQSSQIAFNEGKKLETSGLGSP
jgi:putative transposase